MIERPEYVIGPVGERLTLNTLPTAAAVRWTTLRKAQVVAAVKGGLLTLDEACDRYGLAIEEFTGWQRALQRSGIAGLRVTRLQEYRDRYEKLDGY